MKKESFKFYKMKLISKITFALFLGLTLLSCSEDGSKLDNERNANLEVLLFNKYDLIKIENSTVDFLNENYDGSNLLTYQIGNTNERFFILQNSHNLNKYLVINGMSTKSSTLVLKKVEVTFDLDNDKNGTVEFLNLLNGDQFTSTFKEGLPTGGKTKESNISNDYASKGLCQKKEGETFNECFNRESDEFCSDFISTVAYITNPQIAILIAALCSCAEK